MPARTLNDFFAGFFYQHEGWEVNMGIAVDRGKGKGGVRVITVEGEREKEKEVIIRHEIVSSKWKRWNHDNFSHDWNKNFSV